LVEVAAGAANTIRDRCRGGGCGRHCRTLIATDRSSSRLLSRPVPSRVRLLSEKSMPFSKAYRKMGVLSVSRRADHATGFSRLQCLTSKVFVLSFLPSIIHDWVRTNDVRSNSTRGDGHARSEGLCQPQMAALAAGAQNKLWNFIDTFYHEQGPSTQATLREKYLTKSRAKSRLDLTQWATSESRRYFKPLVADRHTAKLRLRSTWLLMGEPEEMTRLSGYECQSYRAL